MIYTDLCTHLLVLFVVLGVKSGHLQHPIGCSTDFS